MKSTLFLLLVIVTTTLCSCGGSIMTVGTSNMISAPCKGLAATDIGETAIVRLSGREFVSLEASSAKSATLNKYDNSLGHVWSMPIALPESGLHLEGDLSGYGTGSPERLRRLFARENRIGLITDRYGDDDYFEAAREDFETRLRGAVVDVSRVLLHEGDAAGAEEILQRGFEWLPDDEEIGELLQRVLVAGDHRAEAERVRMRGQVEMA